MKLTKDELAAALLGIRHLHVAGLMAMDVYGFGYYDKVLPAPTENLRVLQSSAAKLQEEYDRLYGRVKE